MRILKMCQLKLRYSVVSTNHRKYTLKKRKKKKNRRK